MIINNGEHCSIIEFADVIREIITIRSIVFLKFVVFNFSCIKNQFASVGVAVR